MVKEAEKPVDQSKRDFLKRAGAAGILLATDPKRIIDGVFQFDDQTGLLVPDKTLAVAQIDNVEASLDLLASPDRKAGTGRLITHLKSSKYVVVAMDDCFDTSLTNAALDTAKKAKAKMTFCLIGNRLKISKEHTRTYQRIAKEQDIQNHTMNHGMMGPPHTSDPAKIEYTIGKFRDAVRDAIDPDYQDFGMRPPGGTGVNTSTGWVYGPIRKSCAKHDLDILSWNLESGAVNRGFNSSVALARRDVVSHIRGGVILLLHAIPPDVSILGEIFDTLKAKKLTPVTFSEAVAMGIT